MKNKNENKEKNPLLLLKRLLSYIVKNYKLACFMVVVCILVSALTTLCGTLFIQKLIDNYIVPLTQMAVPDYSPLAQALLKLVGAGDSARPLAVRFRRRFSRFSCAFCRADRVVRPYEAELYRS